MQKVILLSFFNSNNIGDKVIANIMFSELSSQYSVVICSIEGNFEIKNLYVPEKLSIWNRIVIKISHILNIRYLTPRYRNFIKQYKAQLAFCSKVFIGGGNLMMDYTPKSRSYLKISDFTSIAEENGVDCFALSVGIGPFYSDSQARHAAEALNKCKKITFRDEKSYDIFIKNGGVADKARISFDPAFLFSKFYNFSAESGRNLISVNVIYPSWAGKDNASAVLNGYIHLIREIISHNSSAEIALFCTEVNDVKGLQYVAGHVADKNISVYSVSDIKDLINLYQKTKAVIGARMHSLIIAYSCHIPVLGLSWASKVNDFFRIINKPDFCFDIDKMGDCACDICYKLENEMIGWNYDEIISKADEFLQDDFNQIKQL